MKEYPTSPLYQAIYQHVESIDGCAVYFEKIGDMMRIFWNRECLIGDISVFEGTARVDVRSGTWPYPHTDLSINSPYLLEDISRILMGAITHYKSRANAICSE